MRAARAQQFMQGRRGRRGATQAPETGGQPLPPDDPDGGANPPG
jgi:hypothetical protein